MRTGIRRLRAGVSGGAIAASSPAVAGTLAASAESSGLHLRLMWACIAIGLIVFAMIFYSVIEYRRSHAVLKAPWHATTTREMLWTAIPFLMLVALVTPATIALIAYHDAQKEPLTVDISAPPITWRYSRTDRADASATIALSQLAAGPDGRLEIVLPSHRPIKLRLAPGRSIWSIPEAGFHQQAGPAAIAESWLYLPKSGVYEASCSGSCGSGGETTLRLRVRAVPEDVYNHWLESAASGSISATKPPPDR